MPALPIAHAQSRTGCRRHACSRSERRPRKRDRSRCDSAASDASRWKRVVSPYSLVRIRHEHPERHAQFLIRADREYRCPSLEHRDERIRKHLTNRLTRQANSASHKLWQDHENPANRYLGNRSEAPHKPLGPEPEGRRTGPFYDSDRSGARRATREATGVHLRRLSLCRPLGCASGEEDARRGSRDLPCLVSGRGSRAADRHRLARSDGEVACHGGLAHCFGHESDDPCLRAA